MSLFRSPNDDSSSEQYSSSGEPDFTDCAVGRKQPSLVPERDIVDPPAVPQQVEETASESLPYNHDHRDGTEWLPNTAEQHAAVLTSSLLEFAYNVKAAEHLNGAQRTTRFHRDSPQARALGARMFQGASMVLAAHGIVADCVHKDDWRDMRQQYIICVDNLGLQTFNESLLPLPDSLKGSRDRQDQHLIIRRSPRPRPELLDISSSKYFPGRIVDVNEHRKSIATMIRSLVIPSPHAEIQLSSPQSVGSFNRYRAEFWELKQLGKGAFGTVYHVRNFVDNQDYAIKKIPLDPRRLKNWETKGAKEVEALLKEIRTLAKLEHSNIVRYHSAWIEVAECPPVSIDASRFPHQLYVEEKPAPLSLPGKQGHRLSLQESGEADFTDAVFKKDDVGYPADLCNNSEDGSNGVVFGEDSHTSSYRNGISPRADEVVVRGSRRQQDTYDQGSSESSSSNETDIFTDGEGAVRSGDLKQRGAPRQTVMVLHIQMSLHPLSLATYIACPAAASAPISTRHCFHLAPSLRLMRAILSGVEHLHSHGIIHRDLKPGNIFLSEHGEYDQRPGCVDTTCTECEQQATMKRYLNPRIGDFGLVADISGASDAKPSTFQPSRSTFKAVGTEFYRPPLPSRDPPIDEKLDVFALGILLFELLWKMDTKMERHTLLTTLSKKALLPSGFASTINPCGKRRPSAEEAATVQEGCGTSDHFSRVGEGVEECIRNMVAPSSSQRWGCGRVRERLDELIGMLE